MVRQLNFSDALKLLPKSIAPGPQWLEVQVPSATSTPPRLKIFLFCVERDKVFVALWDLDLIEKVGDQDRNQMKRKQTDEIDFLILSARVV